MSQVIAIVILVVGLFIAVRPHRVARQEVDNHRGR